MTIFKASIYFILVSLMIRLNKIHRIKTKMQNYENCSFFYETNCDTCLDHDLRNSSQS